MQSSRHVLASRTVPSYIEAEARLNWRIAGGFELAGTNLHARHQEFVNPAFRPLEVPTIIHPGGEF